MTDQLDKLYAERERMEDFIRSIPGGNCRFEDFKGWVEVNAEIENLLLSPQEREKKAACSICIIASALRVCSDCAFKEYASQHKIQQFTENPDTIAEAVAWAYMEVDPRTPEEKALDEWQADAQETEFGTAQWFKGVQPIEF